MIAKDVRFKVTAHHTVLTMSDCSPHSEGAGVAFHSSQSCAVLERPDAKYYACLFSQSRLFSVAHGPAKSPSVVSERNVVY